MIFLLPTFIGIIGIFDDKSPRGTLWGLAVLGLVWAVLSPMAHYEFLNAVVPVVVLTLILKLLPPEFISRPAH